MKEKLYSIKVGALTLKLTKKEILQTMENCRKFLEERRRKAA